MRKQLAIIRRLELALNQTTSEHEVAKVYGLFAYITKKALRVKQGVFYGTFDINFLNGTSNNIENISTSDIILGEKLAEELRYSINLPKPNARHYMKKMQAAINFEYNKILQFYKEND